jgi:hypothetical protein
LLVPHKGRLSKVYITPTSQEVYRNHLRLFPPLKPGEKLGVNRRFWKMLVAVLRVAFPRWVGHPVCEACEALIRTDLNAESTARQGKRRSC